MSLKGNILNPTIPSGTLNSSDIDLKTTHLKTQLNNYTVENNNSNKLLKLYPYLGGPPIPPMAENAAKNTNRKIKPNMKWWKAKAFKNEIYWTYG